jgi:uncharacterized protein (DUF2147 family)
MMRRMWIAPLLAIWAAPALAATRPVDNPAGLWLSPHQSVVVRTGPCGEKLCGWVAWANSEALADAQDGGVAHLVGTELLQDYRPTGSKNWSGTVFVPDMGRSFSSQIDALSPGQLRIRGCILGGLICKSQIWNRIERLPQ